MRPKYFFIWAFLVFLAAATYGLVEKLPKFVESQVINAASRADIRLSFVRPHFGLLSSSADKANLFFSKILFGLEIQNPNLRIRFMDPGLVLSGMLLRGSFEALLETSASSFKLAAIDLAAHSELKSLGVASGLLDLQARLEGSAGNATLQLKSFSKPLLTAMPKHWTRQKTEVIFPAIKSLNAESNVSWNNLEYRIAGLQANSEYGTLRASGVYDRKQRIWDLKGNIKLSDTGVPLFYLLRGQAPPSPGLEEKNWKFSLKSTNFRDIIYNPVNMSG